MTMYYPQGYLATQNSTTAAATNLDIPLFRTILCNECMQRGWSTVTLIPSFRSLSCTTQLSASSENCFHSTHDLFGNVSLFQDQTPSSVRLVLPYVLPPSNAHIQHPPFGSQGQQNSPSYSHTTGGVSSLVRNSLVKPYLLL